MLSTFKWQRKGPIGIQNDVEIEQHRIAQEASEEIFEILSTKSIFTIEIPYQ